MDDAKTKELLPIYADGEIGARILAAMEAYRREYVYSPEYGSDHEPTDFEQVMLEDFLNGAFTDEVSAILQEAARATAAPQPAASDVPHDVVREPDAWIEREGLEALRRDKTSKTQVASGLLKSPFGDKVPLYATPAPSTSTEDWRDDPSADDRWNAGVDFAQDQLCAVLKIDPKSITWDGGTETLDGDVKSAICKVLTAWAGDDWMDRSSSTEEALRAENAREPSLDAWAYAFAIWRQGQRSTPRCEGPGEADIRICRDLIEGMLACRDTANEIDRRKAASALSETR